MNATDTQPKAERPAGMTQRLSKFMSVNVVQANYGYGHGWEDLTCDVDRKAMREDLRAYRDNAPGYAYRLIRRRVTRDNFNAGTF